MARHFFFPMSFPKARGTVQLLANQKDYYALVLDISEVIMIDYISTRAPEDMIFNALHDDKRVYLVSGEVLVKFW